MKRLLISLLASLALPTAVNGESYNTGVTKIQFLKMQKLVNNAYGLLEIGDYNTACGKFRKYDLLLGRNHK